MKQKSIITTASNIALISVMGLLVACSSSGSDDASTGTTTVSGTVVAAPVSGASVIVKDASGINTLAGPVPTASDGTYSIDPGNASSGAYIIESSGGTYKDEASGDTVDVGVRKLTAYVDGASLASGKQVQVTPASTIVHNMIVDYGVAPADALNYFKDTFGFDADSNVAPANAVDPEPGATDDELLAGLRVAAFSQLTKDLGMTADEQFDLLAALSEDLADGDLDGKRNTVDIAMLPMDVQSRFSSALVTFHEAGTTGLANDKIGVVPFAKVALSSSYKIEYVPGMMAAMEGKTKFKLHVSDKATGVAEMGLTVTLMPMMHMAGHQHSTPKLDCIDVGAGDYDCTLYYLMPSSMADGGSMGYWELKVMAAMNESVTFYPHVMMAMGDTAKIKLQSQTAGTDKIMGMTGEMNRKYFVFKDSMTGMGDNRNFAMFIAAIENMMSYPAVSDGTTLSTGTLYQVIATPMTVEVSTDKTNWVMATDNGNGSWSAAPLSGLVNGVEGKVYVKLTIDSEQKTTNGAAPAGDGTNDYGSFTLTPGGM